MAGTHDSDKPTRFENSGDEGGGGGSSDDAGAGILVDPKVRVERPNLFKVLLHNDDYTPMDFVVDVVERFFSKTHAEATEIMLAIHHKGVGLCGVYPFEVAETKVALVTEAAREHEYPLQCSMERA